MQPELSPGQMWQGSYATKYHVLAIYEDFAWTLVHYPGVSMTGQPRKPQTYSRSFYEQPDMRCIYDPNGLEDPNAEPVYT